MGSDLPWVAGCCPSCGRAELFLAPGGHVTCSIAACRAPHAADGLLHADHADLAARVAELEPEAGEARKAAADAIALAQRHAARVAELEPEAGEARKMAADAIALAQRHAARVAELEPEAGEARKAAADAIALAQRHAARVAELEAVVKRVRATCLVLAQWEPASRRSDHINGMADAGLRLLALLPTEGDG